MSESVPADAPPHRTPGAWAGRFVLADDFDELAPQDEWDRYGD